MAGPTLRSRFLQVYNKRLHDYFLPLCQYALGNVCSFSSRSTTSEYDVVIIGGGIVGMATARELRMRHPQLSFAVLEKENILARHQSGNNSGVMHAGIYYVPGSLKARLCVEGLELAYKYCDQHHVPYKKVGKLIVAVTPEEIPRLDMLYQRGIENGVKDLRMLGPAEIKDVEPNCVEYFVQLMRQIRRIPASGKTLYYFNLLPTGGNWRFPKEQGLKAIHSPHTGIVDWGVVTRDYGKTFEKLGGHIYTNYEVTNFSVTKESAEGSTKGLQFPVTISGKSAQNPELRCKYVVTCGGLQSDKLAEKSGCNREPRIVPFRGEYLQLIPEKCNLVNGNIYPVPDPRFPFLGVHFTPRMDGGVWLGPNAVLAFKREGYGYSDINLAELADAISFRGLRKLALRHLSYGIQEMYKGIFYSAQVKQLQRFVPTLQYSDVIRGSTGVRAQALDRDGNLIEDFVFDKGSGDLASRVLHVRNAPSPAATSSLAIAKMVADRCKQTFEL